MRPLFFFCLMTLFSCFQVGAQPLLSYSEAEAYGSSMLKALEQENVACSMRYEELNRRSSFKKQIRNPYTIYEIKDEFDLKGESIEIPEHCVLVFNGGSLKNGTIVGNVTSYCSKRSFEQSFKCDVEGNIEQIGYVIKASELGMVKNAEKKAVHNYSKLASIVDQGKNLYLDGVYHVVFSTPLVLNKVFRIYGGELVFKNNAFRFSNGGGFVMTGSAVTASKKTPSAFFCGSTDLLDAINIKKLAFYGCTIDCGFLANVLYKDMDSDKVAFGVNQLEVDHCVFKKTGRIRIMDAVIDGTCVFKNNQYQNFTTTPIYICCQHSKQASPNEKSAYQYVANNLTKGCPVIIDHNIFKGASVDLNFYYCSALIKSVDCHFTNNYLQDIINYSDGSNATAYDAYLSCVNVVYENNFVKDMMSFSMDGSSKPQCQIGKSKTNPLSYLAYPAERIYRNNVFLVDGERFLREGADATTLYADIFGNKSYVDEYVWDGNTVILKKANLKTGVAAKSYGSFKLTNNYFDVNEIKGVGLVTIRSAEKMEEILIKGNVFKVGKHQMFPLFNQKYNEGYHREDQKSIVITDNTFYSCAPKIFFFTGEHVVVKNNVIDKCDVMGNLYLSKYSGSGTLLDVKEMDAELHFESLAKNTGGLMQYFSSSSKGTYSIEMDQAPDKGVNYYYSIDKDHQFDLKLEVLSENTIQTVLIPFLVQGGNLSYQLEGKTINVASDKSDSKVWYKGHGVQLKTTFFAGEKKQVVTHLTSHGLSSSGLIHYKFSYISE